MAFVARWRPDLPLLCPCFDTVALCHPGDLGARESVSACLFHRPPARCRRPSAAPEAVLVAPCEFAEKTLLRGASGPRARCSPLRQRLGPRRVGGPVGARPRPAHPGSTSCPGRRQIIETDANEAPSRERGERQEGAAGRGKRVGGRGSSGGRAALVPPAPRGAPCSASRTQRGAAPDPGSQRLQAVPRGVPARRTPPPGDAGGRTGTRAPSGMAASPRL